MTTHNIKLLTGIECEIKELTGREQGLLTRNGGKDFATALPQMLQNIIVRIGSETNITEKLVKDLLDGDRQKILVAARQVSLDFDPVFRFDYTYKKGNGQKDTMEMEVPMEDGKMPEKAYHTKVKEAWEETAYTELTEVAKEITLLLPKSGLKVRYNLLDGHGAESMMKIRKADLDSNTPIKARKLRKFQKLDKDNKELWLSLDPADLALKDIEFLRKDIQKREGRIDTEIIIEHPETGDDIVVNALHQLAFFFPSEAI